MLSFFSGFAGRDEKDILQYSVNIIHLFQIDTRRIKQIPMAQLRSLGCFSEIFVSKLRCSYLLCLAYKRS